LDARTHARTDACTDTQVILYSVQCYALHWTDNNPHKMLLLLPHCVPKLAAPLFQTRLIQFVVHVFQQNIVHCTILTLLTITPIMTYALYHVSSM